MQPNTSLNLNRIYLTSPLLELPPHILIYRLTDCKHEKRHALMKKSDTFHLHFIRTSRHMLQYVSIKQVCFISSFLLEDLADEREDEERKHRAPHERVDHHDHPPEYSTRRSANGVGHNVPRLSEETLEDYEQNKVQHAQRHIGKQKRFHLDLLGLVVFRLILKSQPYA